MQRIRKCLNERYAKRFSNLISVNYSNLMAMKMSAAKSVEEYVSRIDDCLLVLEAASFTVDTNIVIRTVFGGVHSH